ncbi:hypothetical protein [Variovorax gossypii]
MTLPAITKFQQTLAALTGSPVAPGQANFWDLSSDFSLNDGGYDQFDGGLLLSVDVGGVSESFASDQVFGELTALSPAFKAADGVLSVSFSSDPNFASNATGGYAYLHPGVDVRLQQTLNLGSAAGGISLSWTGNEGSSSSNSFSDPTQFGQVVVRDTAGALLTTLYRRDGSGATGTWGSASLTQFGGQTVVLSFEQRVGNRGSTIDNVSVKDSANTEFVVNGDFEAQGTGWRVSDDPVSQNLRSGVRTVSGLEVQRSFFAQPNQLWGRFTDVFHNATASPIVAKVTYFSNLGSDGGGFIYPTPGAPLKGLTTWDSGYRSDRDIGFVFGAVDSTTYQSTSALDVSDGSDDVSFTFNISVPAGGTVTLINFIVLTGIATGVAATDITAKATAVDAAVADIANNFRTQFAYQRGLTQEQLDTLKNF